MAFEDKHGNQVNISGYDISWLASKEVYLLVYNITRAGAYTMEIMINGTAIDGNPYSLLATPGGLNTFCSDAPGPAYGSTSVSYGSGLKRATTKAKETFWVLTKDEWGNALTEGGANFTTKLTDKLSGATR